MDITEKKVIKLYVPERIYQEYYVEAETKEEAIEVLQLMRDGNYTLGKEYEDESYPEDAMTEEEWMKEDT